MHKKQQTGFLVLILVITLSIVACMGTITAIETLPPTSPTNSPLPSETPLPIDTNTVVVPTITPTMAVTEIPPEAGQVNIIDLNGFKDEADYWYFSGLVRNDTQQTIADLQIEVSLFNSTGTEIYTYTTYSMLLYLAPGESSPFSDFTTEPYPDGQTIQASVVGNSSIDAIKRANLEFRGVSLWADDYNDIYLAGEVFNRSADPVEINAIAGTLTDSAGKLVTSSSGYPHLSYVEPNGSSPFVMMFDAPIGLAASLTNYTLYSDVLVTVPTTRYDITISDTHFKYQDTSGDMHLVGSVTNNISEPLNIYLVAGMYDKDGNCIDANVVYLPIPLNPGATFPYDFSLWGAVDYVPAAYEAATEYKIFVDWLSTYEASSQSYTLSTKDDSNAFDGTTFYFTGTVINNSGQDLSSALVSISLYDKTSGDLIATNLNFVAESLTKDSSGTYEVYLYPANDINPADVSIEIIALGQ
jgi:hypothetical protein